MWFKYILKSFFKLLVLLITVSMLIGLKEKPIEPAGAVFLIILFCVNVSTVYDLGDGYYLQVISGGSILGAFIGFILAYMAMEWVVDNSHIVLGIAVLFYALNQLIEAIRYREHVDKFFTISGIVCSIMIAIEGFNCFKEQSFVEQLTENFFGIFVLAVTVLLFIINIFVRAGEAKYVED